MPAADHASSRPDPRRRRGSVRTKVVTSLVLLGVMAVVAFGLMASPGEEPKGQGVTLAPASVLDFDISTSAIGELEARRSVEIRSQVGANAAIIELAPEGSRVKKGDVVVALNGEELDDEIKRQRLEVEAAKAEMITAENELRNQIDQNASDLRKAELAVAIAELELAQWKVDFEKRGIQFRNALERAQTNLVRLEEQLEQTKKLREADFASENELKEVTIEHTEAKGQLQVAEKELFIFENYTHEKEQKEAESKVTEARAELERVKRANETQIVIRNATLDNRREQLAGRTDQLVKLESQLENCVMRAPIDGLVLYATSREDRWDDSRGTLQIGRQVSYRELLIILPDTSEMMASVKVHESIAGRVKEGLRAEVKIDAMGGAVLAGTVASTGVLPDTGGWRDPNRREYTVKILLDPSEYASRLKPSMRAEAKIQLGRVEDALSVPLQAVFRDGAASFVYVPRGNRYERRLVRVGRRSDTYAEILAGLSEGDLTLVREPAAGEVLPGTWTDAQLAEVGLSRDASGVPVPEGGSSGPREGGRNLAPESASDIKTAPGGKTDSAGGGTDTTT